MGGSSMYLDVERFKVIKILLLAFVGLSCCEFLVDKHAANMGAVRLLHQL
jgi:hypothetical protein